MEKGESEEESAIRAGTSKSKDSFTNAEEQEDSNDNTIEDVNTEENESDDDDDDESTEHTILQLRKYIALSIDRPMDNGKYACKVPSCAYATKAKRDMKDHILAHYKKTVMAAKCKLCKKKFVKSKQVRQHCKNTHKIDTYKVDQSKWLEEDESLSMHNLPYINKKIKFICNTPNCGENFESKDETLNHILIDHFDITKEKIPTLPIESINEGLAYVTELDLSYQQFVPHIRYTKHLIAPTKTAKVRKLIPSIDAEVRPSKSI